MKVYLEPPERSFGLMRVYSALIRYAPDGVSVVSNKREAELVILHVVGRRDRVGGEIDGIKIRGQKYAIIQYCLRSTQKPSTHSWFPLWQDARVVWSYYDLRQWCIEDGAPAEFPFYHAPLGADPAFFRPRHLFFRPYLKKEFVIATCGHHALTQSIKEAVVAAKRLGRKVFHLGHELRRGADVECVSGIDDEVLAQYYSRCEFVSGLRRIEGFELPAVEGLLCGARPILFNRPHYKQWFHDLALFIPEGNREQATDTLEAVFEEGAAPVTAAEIEEAKRRFDWQKIITGFWERVLE